VPGGWAVVPGGWGAVVPGGWGAVVPGGWGVVSGGWGAVVPGGWGVVPGGWGAVVSGGWGVVPGGWGQSIGRHGSGSLRAAEQGRLPGRASPCVQLAKGWSVCPAGGALSGPALASARPTIWFLPYGLHGMSKTLKARQVAAFVE